MYIQSTSIYYTKVKNVNKRTIMMTKTGPTKLQIIPDCMVNQQLTDKLLHIEFFTPHKDVTILVVLVVFIYP